MPKVSVIVPVYNVEKYLIKSLDSLVNQTLEDIEIIVVNDGSTDNSKKIIEVYKEKYQDKIKYLEKPNGGLSDARNFGIPYATGEYIAFLDSDDYVELDTYEKMYNKAKEENADMVECDFIWEYPNKSKIDNGIIYNGKKEMLIYARVVAWNKLIKRTLLEKYKIEFPKGLRYEDVEFFYKMVLYYNKVSFVKEPLIHYIQRESSISKVQNEKTKEIFEVLDNVIKYYKNKNLYNEYKDELEYTYTRLLLCSSLFRMVKIKDKKVKKELLNTTWTNLNEKFPNWKKNKILKENKSMKNLYMKTINKITYKIYCAIFSIVK
ncbi:MAG: glycosyltransferase [Clostridia bacterium]|nr:glycosyltransferase [Clostridia bacterium]